MERGTILWGLAGFIAGFFISKSFAVAQEFGKAVGERGTVPPDSSAQGPVRYAWRRW